MPDSRSSQLKSPPLCEHVNGSVPSPGVIVNPPPPVFATSYKPKPLLGFAMNVQSFVVPPLSWYSQAPSCGSTSTPLSPCVSSDGPESAVVSSDAVVSDVDAVGSSVVPT